MQALNSVTTLVHMTLFAILLPRGAFDDYSVWVTSSMFAVGLGQAVGSERVIIGRRSFADGISAAWALAAIIFVVQLAMAIWLRSPVLVLSGIGIFLWAVWDYLRIVQGFEHATTFLRRDLSVVVSQCVAVVLASVAGLSGDLIPLVWWGLGTVLWSYFVVKMAMAGRAARRGGFGVLWTDRRESAPLLLDAALAGVPIVLALAMANAQGAPGDASAARMAFTILGPIAVLGMAGRRIVYAARAQGGFSARTRLYFTLALFVIFGACFGILAMTRTPLYPLVLPGFAGLAWFAIVGFSLNHASVMAAMLPAANLRAEKRTLEVGLARIVATVVAVLFVVLLGPFDSVSHVAWCVASSSVAYAIVLYGVGLVRPTQSNPAPVEAVS